MERHHVNLIKLWAENDDLEIEFLSPGGKWVLTVDGTQFHKSISYRLLNIAKGIVVSFSAKYEKPVEEEELDYNVTF